MSISRTIKIKLVTFLVIFCFSFNVAVKPADAFLFPVFMYMGLPAAAVDFSIIAHTVVGFALWWYNSNNGKKTTDNNGNLTSDGQVQWVDLNASPGQAATYKATTANKVNFADAQSAVNANKTKYPHLAQAMGYTGKQVVATNGSTYELGTVLANTVGINNLKPGGGYWVTATSFEFQANCSWIAGNPDIVLERRVPNATSSKYDEIAWSIGSPAVATPSEFAAAVRTSDTDNTVKSDFSGEINDLITSNPNIVHYEDGSGNSAASQIPSTAATQPQLDAFTGTSGGSGGGSGGGTGGGTGDGTGTGSSNTDGLLVTANATLKSIDGKAGSIEGLLGDIKGGLEDTTSKPAEDPQEEQNTTNARQGSYDTNLTTPEKKDIPTLLDWIKANSPLVGLAQSIRLNTSDEQSSFSFAVYGKTITADFSRFTSVLNIAGTALLAIMHVYAVLLIFRRED